jgi:hypothetical protein
MERKITMKNQSKIDQNLANGEVFESYSSLGRIFGDSIQLNEDAFKNQLLRKILCMMMVIVA